MSAVELGPRGGRRTRAAVVGSGFGGLAVAIRLQNAGFDTCIYEANDQPGGRASVFRDQGYVFDAGPTVITAPHCLEELWSEAGRSMRDYVELLPVDPFYRLQWGDGSTFDYTGDLERTLEQIRRISPKDEAGYQRFLAYSKAVFDEGYTKLAASPFLNFSDMLRALPQLGKLRADRSVYRTVSRFIENERLREAFSFHSLLVGGNPFETSAIYTLIHYLERNWGVFFPRGGTSALVQAMVRLFEELGGELRLSQPVTRIAVEGQNGKSVHRVHTEQGRAETFDLVVSNADLLHTYGELLRDDRRAQRVRKRVEGLDWSMSLFVLYFGTDRLYRDRVAHHTVLFGPRYEALLAEVFHGHELPDDFSLYLHAPTVSDPDLAPPGCDSFYVLSPVPHLGHAPIDWNTVAPFYADRILHALEAVLPDLRRHVVVKRMRTPLHFRDELRSHHGSAFSCAPTLSQSAWFRPHNRDPRIPGLYLVGAGTHPGAGVPGVVNSAKATFGLILQDFAT